MPFESLSVFTNKNIYLNVVVVRLQDKDDDLVVCKDDAALQIHHSYHYLLLELHYNEIGCLSLKQEGRR